MKFMKKLFNKLFFMIFKNLNKKLIKINKD